MRWLRITLVAAVLLVISPGRGQAASRQVYINDAGPGDSPGVFVASSSGGSEAKIQQYDTVFWRNNDGTAHDVVGEGWGTGRIEPQTERSHTFNTAGNFPYHCSIHPSMTGRLVVEAGPPPATSAPTTAAPSGSATTVRSSTATTARGSATTTRGAASSSNDDASEGSTTTAGFGVLAPTSATTSTSTTGDVAINEKDTSSGGANPLGVAAIAFGVFVVLGAAGYVGYRLRGAGTAAKGKG